ncbi:MAG: hypothetical protein K2N48_13410 [Muribaculaceae bacterium]|nr:hypothetical protein [Muribaculaceae bacterium]
MKKIFIYALPALAMGVASCADGYEGDFKMDKPESVEHAEYLASLGTLNSVIDRAANPNFKLGLAVSSADYASQGLTYSVAVTNFDFVTDYNTLAYSTILNEDGDFVLVPVTDMFLQDGPKVAGGAMLAYNALPTAHLEEVISPTFIKGDLAVGTFAFEDFDDDELGKEYTMSNGSVAVVSENPTGAEGHVLKIGSEESKARNSYPVLTIPLPNNMTVGNVTSVVFDLYCPDDKSQKRNFVAIVNDVRCNYTGDTPDKRGCPLQTWMNKMVLDLTQVELTDDIKSATEMTLAFGPNVNSSYYFLDNIQIGWTTGVPDKYVDKNEAEKAEALSDNFGSWADVVMASCAPSMTDYVVLANPMSDNAPYALRSAASETVLDEEGNIVNDLSGMFFFNDYMGDNYVKTVTDCLLKSYKASEGAGNPNFFVSESGLLGNSAKTQSLINQVASWSNAGAKIDGIAVVLNNLDPAAVTRQEITDLFTSLAGSGKLVRLDNLSVASADADFYGFVVSEYFRLIKAENRAGIIFSCMGDLWKNNARTDAYEAILNALSAK